MSVVPRCPATVAILALTVSACGGSNPAQAPAPTTAQAKSCSELHASDPSLGDGPYLIDLDGPGPAPARSLYCDMRSGGWTLIANQVPGALLPDKLTTINAGGFGSQDQSYRLGDPEIGTVFPRYAWKLTDGTNTVFFRPACVVSWKKNFADFKRPTDCTTGYTTEQFTSIVNGQWLFAPVRGIGINNNAHSCSIQMFHPRTDSMGNPLPGPPVAAGSALACDYSAGTQRVSLWFR